MTRLVYPLIVLVALAGLSYWLFSSPSPTQVNLPPATWWQVQSIDTMKYSRDPSREKLADPSFDQVIDTQVKNIADIGATHVAIATPYDQEFLPMLHRWVAAARKYSLKVWFRGNWSGWEGWFNYPRISRQEHLQNTQAFILANADLFENGDIFSACPECENGGPGDPRHTGDIAGHRAFLIEEYRLVRQAFRLIDRNVQANFHPMNGDVARAIMDKNTTQALGGLVVIDHYVANPDQLAQDVQDIAAQSGGQVVLGEFGAPIPDIHGSLPADDQAAWINQALTRLAPLPQLIGINYWVNVGGSTQLWDIAGTPKPAVSVISSFFQPSQVRGLVADQFGRPIPKAQISSSHKTVRTNNQGQFALPYLFSPPQLTISATGFADQTLTSDSISSSSLKITLASSRSGLFPRNKLALFFKLRSLLRNLFNF